jgi:hypothetical protein
MAGLGNGAGVVAIGEAGMGGGEIAVGQPEGQAVA